jgi:hypothetical protein
MTTATPRRQKASVTSSIFLERDRLDSLPFRGFLRCLGGEASLRIDDESVANGVVFFGFRIGACSDGPADPVASAGIGL